MNGLPTPLQGPDDNTSFVPVVVIVRKSDLDRLNAWVATSELPHEVRWAVGILSARYGYTEHMLKCGALLATAVEDVATPNRRRPQ